MKSIFFLSVVIACFTSCLKDSITEKYSLYRPVYQTKEAVRNNIKSNGVSSVDRPGKIVLYGSYLFMNDLDKGIHVIDVSDPAQPKKRSFITIPGCDDIAINGNYLYADCYTDLVTMDISNPANITVKQFLPGVFPHRNYYAFQADTNQVIVKWVKVDTVVKHVFGDSNGFSGRGIFFSPLSSFAFSSFSGTTSIGLTGSTARFGLLKSRLYTVSHEDLKVFNVQQASNPSYVQKIPLFMGNIETIFPYKNNLFIGAQSGMQVFATTNPDQPQKLSQFVHARACDPVVADDQYAYVTLSGGSACGGFSNQLDVINITTITQPVLIKTYQLQSPKGLSKDGQYLLICDGTDGLKIFDASDPLKISLITNIGGFEAQDLIAYQGYAFVMAKDGLHIIDYRNVRQAKQISLLPLN